MSSDGDPRADMALATLRAVAPEGSAVWVDEMPGRFVAHVLEPDGPTRAGSARGRFAAIQAALGFYAGRPHQHAAFDDEGEEIEPMDCRRRNCEPESAP